MLENNLNCPVVCTRNTTDTPSSSARVIGQDLRRGFPCLVILLWECDDCAASGMVFEIRDIQHTRHTGILSEMCRTDLEIPYLATHNNRWK